MFENSPFPMKPEQFAEMFKSADLTKMMEKMKVPGFDAAALAESQKKNMDALMEANKAAAAGYQDLFKKQIAIFEETMAEARTRLAEFDMSKMTPETAQASAEVTRAAYEKAIAHMTELATAAKDANSAAFEVVSARMKESLAELQDMAAKAAK